MFPRLRLTIWTVLAVAIPLGTAGWLFALRGPRILDHDSILIAGWITLTTLLLCVAVLLRTTPADAIKLSTAASARLIVGVTVLLHLTALVFIAPALSEDSDPLEHHVFWFRLIFASFSIASAWLLVRVLVVARQSAWWAVLFAWNPLVVLETAGTGHGDIVGVFLLLVVLWMMQRRWFGRAAVMLALATGVKPLAVVLLPFMYRDAHEHGDWREGRRMLLIFAACAIAILAAPFLYHNGSHGWLGSARIFSPQSEANGSIYELIKHLFGESDKPSSIQRAKSSARLLGVAMLLLGGLLLWQARATLAEAGYWLFLLVLLFSPTVCPWDLLWVLALVPLIRGQQGWTGMFLGGAVVLSYRLWHVPHAVMPGRLLMLEYLPVYAVLLCEIVALLMRPPLSRWEVTSPRH